MSRHGGNSGLWRKLRKQREWFIPWASAHWIEARRRITGYTQLHIFTTWEGKIFFFKFYLQCTITDNRNSPLFILPCFHWPWHHPHLLATPGKLKVTIVMFHFISVSSNMSSLISYLAESHLTLVPPHTEENAGVICVRLPSSCRQHSCTCLFWPFQQHWCSGTSTYKRL